MKGYLLAKNAFALIASVLLLLSRRQCVTQVMLLANDKGIFLRNSLCYNLSKQKRMPSLLEKNKERKKLGEIRILETL